MTKPDYRAAFTAWSKGYRPHDFGGEQAIDIFVDEVYGVQHPEADLDETRMDLTLWLQEPDEISRIDELENMTIYGNGHDDAPLFALADDIIHSDEPMDVKIRALRMIDKAMGEDKPVTEADVTEYLQQTAE